MNLDIRFFREHRFAAFDPSSGTDSPLTDINAVLIRHPALALSEDLLPRLVDLGSAGSDAVGHVFDVIDSCLAAKRASGVDAAFNAETSLQHVAEHLGRQSVRSLGRFGKHWVRVWDSNVLMHLLWIWPGEELRRLFGPISTWCLFLPGEVVPIQRDSLSGLGVDGVDRRHQAVLDVSILNSALSGMQWRFAEVAKLAPRLWEHVVLARRDHQLHDETDLALFARQAHRWGVDFAKHPEIKSALSMAQDGETLYRDALAQIDEQRMQHIEAELSA